MAGTVSRRGFVESGAAVAAFTIVPRHVLGGRGFTAPSDKLNIACIGVGGMGKNDVEGVSGENVYALCDVDQKAAEESYRLQPKAKRYVDFREMLDREQGNIDAVTVSTPDHLHAAAAMMALKLGKHTYCQKPLARTLHEVRALAAAARGSKVSTQMGNQGHTFEGTKLLREYVEAGVIGTVRECTTGPIGPSGPRASTAPPRCTSRRLRSTGISGSAPRRTGRTIPPMPRSAGAAGGTSAPARWATWPATAWTPPSGSSISATPSG